MPRVGEEGPGRRAIDAADLGQVRTKLRVESAETAKLQSFPKSQVLRFRSLEWPWDALKNTGDQAAQTRGMRLCAFVRPCRLLMLYLVGCVCPTRHRLLFRGASTTILRRHTPFTTLSSALEVQPPPLHRLGLSSIASFRYMRCSTLVDPCRVFCVGSSASALGPRLQVLRKCTYQAALRYHKVAMPKTPTSSTHWFAISGLARFGASATDAGSPISWLGMPAAWPIERTIKDPSVSHFGYKVAVSADRHIARLEAAIGPRKCPSDCPALARRCVRRAVQDPQALRAEHMRRFSIDVEHPSCPHGSWRLDPVSLVLVCGAEEEDQRRPRAWRFVCVRACVGRGWTGERHRLGDSYEAYATCAHAFFIAQCSRACLTSAASRHSKSASLGGCEGGSHEGPIRGGCLECSPSFCGPSKCYRLVAWGFHVGRLSQRGPWRCVVKVAGRPRHGICGLRSCWFRPRPDAPCQRAFEAGVKAVHSVAHRATSDVKSALPRVLHLGCRLHRAVCWQLRSSAVDFATSVFSLVCGCFRVLRSFSISGPFDIHSFVAGLHRRRQGCASEFCRPAPNFSSAADRVEFLGPSHGMSASQRSSMPCARECARLSGREGKCRKGSPLTAPSSRKAHHRCIWRRPQHRPLAVEPCADGCCHPSTHANRMLPDVTWWCDVLVGTTTQNSDLEAEHIRALLRSRPVAESLLCFSLRECEPLAHDAHRRARPVARWVLGRLYLPFAGRRSLGTRARAIAAEEGRRIGRGPSLHERRSARTSSTIGASTSWMRAACRGPHCLVSRAPSIRADRPSFAIKTSGCFTRSSPWASSRDFRHRVSGDRGPYARKYERAVEDRSGRPPRFGP